MSQRRWWIAGLGVIAWSAHTASSAACSCAEPRPVTEERDASVAVFTGVVRSVSRIEHGWAVAFDVDRSWKHVSGNAITVSTPDGDASCGYEFEAGRSYLVYAVTSATTALSGLVVYTCSRTRALEFAAEDLPALGEPTYVAPEDSDADETIDEARQRTGDAEGGCALNGSLQRHPGAAAWTAVLALGALVLRRRRPR